MQDIAGVRIVADMDRVEQDAMVDRIRVLFDGSKVIDRRLTPSHGYRAVHVIVSTGGHLVEIQVRTELQHLWAQAVERVADMFGRGIRYGEQVSGELATELGEIVRGLLFMSELISYSEMQQVSVRLLQARAHEFFGEGREPQLFQSIKSTADRTEHQLLDACRVLLDTITARQSPS